MPWIEVRPLQTAKVEPLGLLNAINSLHATRQTFRFLICYCESPTVEGRKVLRFFFEVDGSLKSFLKNFLSSIIDAEVVDFKPPSKIFKYRMSLELAQNPALPITQSLTDPKDNPMDTIAQAMVKDECLLEVTAKRDDGAKLEMEKYLLKRTTNGVPFHQSFVEVVLGILGALAFGQNAHHRETYSQRKILGPSAQALSEEARKKVISNLFLADIKIYSNSPDDIKVIVGAHPNYGLNRFKASKLRQNKRRKSFPGGIIEPARQRMRIMLSHLWKIVPLSIMALSLWLGFFNPIHFLSELTTSDFFTLTLVTSTSFALGIAFRRHHPIILSSNELALIMNLPSQLRKLPVQLGGIPPARVGAASADPRFSKQGSPSF
ncbi:MAG: hypothetical protein HY619_05030 [Thaumarchaeota archaeon]|nr:hypothetical protein [Nitrososphaerota archaeon]